MHKPIAYHRISFYQVRVYALDKNSLDGFVSALLIGAPELSVATWSYGLLLDGVRRYCADVDFAGSELRNEFRHPVGEWYGDYQAFYHNHLARGTILPRPPLTALAEE